MSWDNCDSCAALTVQIQRMYAQLEEAKKTSCENCSALGKQFKLSEAARELAIKRLLVWEEWLEQYNICAIETTGGPNSYDIEVGRFGAAQDKKDIDDKEKLIERLKNEIEEIRKRDNK